MASIQQGFQKSLPNIMNVVNVVPSWRADRVHAQAPWDLCRGIGSASSGRLTLLQFAACTEALHDGVVD